MTDALPLLDSPQNPRVKAWKQDLTKRRSDIIAIESRHPVEEALRQNIPVTDILVSDPSQWQLLQGQCPDRVFSASVWQASPRVLSALSSTRQPPPVMALAQRPKRHSLPEFWQHLAEASAHRHKPCRVLWLHQLQDPGNTGTLIRSARAFGIDGILLGQPMVDVWSPKVIRSTAGWGFGLPMAAVDINNLTALAASLPDSLAQQPFQWAFTTGQHASRTVIPHTQLNPTQPWVCILGNEGAGLEDALFNECQQHLPAAHNAYWVTIPTTVESLNVGVSGSILMAHLHDTHA